MSSSGPVTSTTRTVSVCILQRVGFFARFRVTQVQSLNNAGITPFLLLCLSFLSSLEILTIRRIKNNTITVKTRLFYDVVLR